MTDQRLFSPDSEDEPTVKPEAGYRQEGNENGVLREYLFELREETLCEGLSFPAEEEKTWVPDRPGL